MKIVRGLALAALYLALLSSTHAQSPPSGSPISGVPINRSTINSSATITTGNTFQTVLASNFGTATQRQALTIQNSNATDSCWLTFGTLSNGTKITATNAAKATSILLLAGGSYTRYFPYVPNDEIEATCASNSDTLYIETQ